MFIWAKYAESNLLPFDICIQIIRSRCVTLLSVIGGFSLENRIDFEVEIKFYFFSFVFTVRLKSSQVRAPFIHFLKVHSKLAAHCVTLSVWHLRNLLRIKTNDAHRAEYGCIGSCVENRQQRKQYLPRRAFRFFWPLDYWWILYIRWRRFLLSLVCFHFALDDSYLAGIVFGSGSIESLRKWKHSEIMISSIITLDRENCATTSNRYATDKLFDWYWGGWRRAGKI